MLPGRFSVVGGMAAVKQKKRFRMVRRAFNMLRIFKLGSDLSVPHRRDGIGTLPFTMSEQAGCQGFTGPLPSAFLDKQVKNCHKDKQPSPYFVIILAIPFYL
jgi:hypothetical protein